MNAPQTFKLPRPKKCKVCMDKFQPTRRIQPCCQKIECMVEYGTRVHAKRQKALVSSERRKLAAERREHRQKKLAIKSLSEWHEDVKLYFNRFIRLRDGKVCISCGTQKPTIQYCAGHFRTVGAAGHLRYNEDNVHSQCNKRCNLELSGNLRAYRPALIAKIGQERFDAIENNNTVHKWTVEELKALKKHYQLKCKELENDSKH